MHQAGRLAVRGQLVGTASVNRRRDLSSQGRGLVPGLIESALPLGDEVGDPAFIAYRERDARREWGNN